MELKHYENGRELMAAVIRGEVTDRLPRDGVDYVNVFNRVEYPAEIRDGFGIDRFGVYLRQAPDGLTPDSHYDIDDWESYPFPDVNTLGIEADAKKVLAGFDHDKMMLRMDIPYCHFERMSSIFGMEETLMALYSEPEIVQGFFARLTDYFIEKFRLFKQYYDVDILVCHDDWGENRNMFFSPEVWRAVFKPELKRLIDAVHDMGMYYEQHSCGHIEEIIGDLVELGVDILQPLMSSCNNIPAIKAAYGDKLVMSGACDTRSIVDANADEATVRRLAREAIETCAPGGRYIPSRVVYGPGNAWKKDIIEDEIRRYEARLND